MTATNHALTGAVIGLAMGQPLLALPIAFVSHFICDALPHFGPGDSAPDWISSRAFQLMLLIDASLCGGLVLVLALKQPHHWLLAASCAFIAASPDFFWLNRYVQLRRGKSWRPNAFSRFAKAIQWYEKPRGAVVELAWGSAGLLLIAHFI